MVRNLQRKFIKITMLSLLIVLLLVEGATNGIFIYQTGKKSENLLRMLVDNNGKFPEGKKPMVPDKNERIPDGRTWHPGDHNPFGFRMSEETPFETRYFSVIVSDSGEMNVDIAHIAAVTEEEARSFVEALVKQDKMEGYVEYYRYRMNRKEGSSLLVFVDCSNDIQTVRNFALVSFLVGVGCFLLVLILVSLFSRRAIRPVIESVEKQKQFITDAGHEIKTPIAIISANTEVIEMCGGESEWTKSIHNQVNRLNELVKNLLTLAKLDETSQALYMEEFNLSSVVKEVLSGFEALAQTKNQDVEEKVEKTVAVKGDKSSIRNLVSILMDNAVKYTPEGGKISIQLKQCERQTELLFYNECEEIPSGDLNRLFDRFYRTDESRSRESGGYGIGLSVAYSIVKAHKWKISVWRKGKGICFQISCPSQGHKV